MADASERANSVFIEGLKNAHALERQALELMNRQVERIENYPRSKPSSSSIFRRRTSKSGGWKAFSSRSARAGPF